MVAHYRYQQKKGSKWINVGTSDCSSIPEVVHWIAVMLLQYMELMLSESCILEIGE